MKLMGACLEVINHQYCESSLGGFGLTREAWNVESWQKCGSVVECGGGTPRPWEEEEEASA